MNEFINKLIERLEECKNAELSREDNVDENCMYNDCEEAYDDGESNGRYQMCVKMLKFVKQLAEEYKVFGNSEQLNGGWIPVSSGKLPDDGVPVDVTVREDNDNEGYDLYVFESWYQEGRWAIGKNRYNPTIIAWKPKDAPYQPKGE